MTTGERLIAVTLPQGGAELTDVRGDAVWLPDGPLPAEAWVFIAGRTGMMVKRAAVGAEGYVLDHYDRAALQAHLDAVGTPMLDALRDTPPATIFCDSLEVFGSDWTPTCCPSSNAGAATTCGRISPRSSPARTRRDIAVRQDWSRTLGELYEERFLAPLAEWTHARRLEAAHPGLWASAGHAVEQPPRRSAGRRGRAVEDDHAGALGLLGQPSVRSTVTASETWTWSVLALVRGDAARPQGWPIGTSSWASTS